MFIPRKARNLLIYPSFQLRLVVINGLVLLALFGLVAFMVHKSFENLAAQAATADLPSRNPYFVFMGYEEQLLLSYVAVALLLGILVTAIVNLVLSHRIAGPILRTKTYLEGIRRYLTVGHPRGENLPALKFRKGDFFEDLPEEINAALHACVRSGASGNTVVPFPEKSPKDEKLEEKLDAQFADQGEGRGRKAA